MTRTPSQQAQDRLNAYEMMNSLNFRNAEHLNAPLEFMTQKPFAPTDSYPNKQKRSIGVMVQDTVINTLKRSSFLSGTTDLKNSYTAHMNAYHAYANNSRGFYAMA